MKFIKYRPALQKTFFYEREDGSWFVCEETEASLHEKRRSNRVRLVGVSDGAIYFKMMNDKIKEINEKVAELEKKGLTPAKYDAKIEKLNEELLSATREAKQAEYEHAKGHIEKPVDPNIKRMSGLTGGQQSSLSRMIG